MVKPPRLHFGAPPLAPVVAPGVSVGDTPPPPNPPGHKRTRGENPWPVPPGVVIFVGLLGGGFDGVFVGPSLFFKTHPFSPTLSFNPYPFPWPPPPPLFLGGYPANVGRVPVKGGVIIYPPWLLGDFPASQAGFIIAYAATIPPLFATPADGTGAGADSFCVILASTSS